MEITSPVFNTNQPIPQQYTCDGEDKSPPLTFNDVPDEAKSLVLIMDDPDAPAGTWVHWTVWNIAPTTPSLDEARIPSNAIQGITSFGQPAYGGPCPPSGVHHYHFKLYALDRSLSLDAAATKADLEAAMEGHMLAQAELVGTYERKK